MSDLKDILIAAATVVLLRRGDVDTEDGSYATVDIDSLLRLDYALAEFFELDSDDVTFENIDGLIQKINSNFTAIQFKPKYSWGGMMNKVIAGWGSGLTGPTTPSDRPTVAKDWNYIPVSKGTETLCIVIRQEKETIDSMNRRAEFIANSLNLFNKTK